MAVFSRVATATTLFCAVFAGSVFGAVVEKEYDYVIVGGGVTGLIVANRLSELKDSRCNNAISVLFTC